MDRPENMMLSQPLLKDKSHLYAWTKKKGIPKEVRYYKMRRNLLLEVKKTAFIRP